MAYLADYEDRIAFGCTQAECSSTRSFSKRYMERFIVGRGVVNVRSKLPPIPKECPKCGEPATSIYVPEEQCSIRCSRCGTVLVYNGRTNAWEEQ